VDAASLGCRFATAFRALNVHGRVQAGQWVAVHGCGGVGLSAVMIAAALGARVIAVDVNAAALARAAELGATVLLDLTSQPDAAAAVVAASAGGAHVSMDAIGSAAAAGASVRSLRRRGRHLQVGLLHGDDAINAVPMNRVIAHELEVYGSHGMAPHEYPAMLQMVVSGALRPGLLVTSVIGLDGVAEALLAMDGPATPGITVIVP
jgi:alcohol dehydrogenase